MVETREIPFQLVEKNSLQHRLCKAGHTWRSQCTLQMDAPQVLIKLKLNIVAFKQFSLHFQWKSCVKIFSFYCDKIEGLNRILVKMLNSSTTHKIQASIVSQIVIKAQSKNSPFKSKISIKGCC